MEGDRRINRYIDADKLIPLIKMGETNEYTELGEGRNGGIAFAIERIKQMPTADVRENVHGEWMYTKHYGEPYRVCPKCHMERKDDLSRGWNFCPNCGASMLKEVK